MGLLNNDVVLVLLKQAMKLVNSVEWIPGRVPLKAWIEIHYVRRIQNLASCQWPKEFQKFEWDFPNRSREYYSFQGQ